MYLVILPIIVAVLLYQPIPVTHSHGNVLLLTAHPDDECLFFAPTIRSLTRHSNANLYSLCLSAGDADGLGHVRKNELAASLNVLGVRSNQSWVLDHPHLQDNFTTYWNSSTIYNAIHPYIVDHNITTILTFDHHGVSGHPNHCSLPAVASHLHHSPRVYSLTTRSLATKYTGILAPLASKVSFYQSFFYPYLSSLLTILGIPLDLVSHTNTDTNSIPPLVISGFADYLTALNAMRAHSTQLVWFRWLYVLFSRYMWVNEWVQL